MVEFLGKKLEASNDNLIVGDYVVATKESLKQALTKHFGPKTRLRIAEVKGQSIRVVDARDYKPNMVFGKGVPRPNTPIITNWIVQADDIKKGSA